MNQATKLLKDIEKLINNWDEYHSFTIKGVKNLSRSDLDCLELYARQYLLNQGSGFSPLSKPLGDIKSVLDKYKMTDNSNSFCF